jgi:hypothetical protein
MNRNLPERRKLLAYWANYVDELRQGGPRRVPGSNVIPLFGGR